MSFLPGSLYQVTLSSEYLGQALANVFWYGTVTEITYNSLKSSELGLEFADAILPSIQSVVSAATVFTRIQVVELRGGDSIADIPLDSSTGGARGGSPMPAWDAWAFKSVRVSRQVRSAQKRFGGLSETDLTNGGADGGVLSALNGLAVILGTSISLPSAPTPLLSPLAMSFYENKVVRADPVADLANQWEFVRVTSQVSRRPGN